MAAKLSPVGLEATMQALFQATYIGIGQGVGCLFARKVSAGVGMERMFLYSAGVVVGGWVPVAVARVGMRFRKGGLFAKSSMIS